MVELAQRFVDRTDHRAELLIGERQETLVRGLQRVGRERLESVGKLALGAFEQNFLLGEAALALLHPHRGLAYHAFPAAGGDKPGDGRAHRQRHDHSRQQFHPCDLPDSRAPTPTRPFTIVSVAARPGPIRPRAPSTASFETSPNCDGALGPRCSAILARRSDILASDVRAVARTRRNREGFAQAALHPCPPGLRRSRQNHHRRPPSASPAATAHLRTAVITVDPARRLREALGLPRLGGRPTRIDARRLRAAGLDPALKLSAMVLDVKGEWDAMVAAHVADPAIRRRILDNAFYRSLSTQFAGSDAYAALEALHDLHEEGRFDLEVVDTPPAAHAFEFVQAPARLMRLLDSRAARWLLRRPGDRLRWRSGWPGGSRATSRASWSASPAATRSRPSPTSSPLPRAPPSASPAGCEKVSALLRSPPCVSCWSPPPSPTACAKRASLSTSMASEGLHFGAIVINRFLDESIYQRIRARSRALDEIPRLSAALEADGAAR